MNPKSTIKGRGAQSQVHNKFIELSHEERDDFLNYCAVEDEDRTVKTTFIETFPKSIINKVTSPDVGMSYSLNPYQGCEHGCVYCYARNSHEYWGYGAGIDFESKILIKSTFRKETTKQVMEGCDNCLIGKYRLLSTYRKIA